MLSHSVVSNSSRPHGLYPTWLLCPWDFPGKNTGVGFHFLLQWIFLTGELNWGLLHCRRILYQLSYQGSPNCVSEGMFPQATSICWECVCVCVCVCFPRQSLHPRNTVGKILKEDFVLGLYFCFFLFVCFIFNWRIVALQHCVGFCQISSWISHRYTYVPSLLTIPLPPSPSLPSRLLQSWETQTIEKSVSNHFR